MFRRALNNVVSNVMFGYILVVTHASHGWAKLKGYKYSTAMQHSMGSALPYGSLGMHPNMVKQ